MIVANLFNSPVALASSSYFALTIATKTGRYSMVVNGPGNPFKSCVFSLGNSASISPLPVPAASVLGGCAVGAAYSETITAQGGAGGYTFAVTGGALPTGTSLNGSTGVISGTPSAAGTYSFTIKVTDSLGNAGSQNFSITVSVPVSGNWGYIS